MPCQSSRIVRLSTVWVSRLCASSRASRHTRLSGPSIEHRAPHTRTSSDITQIDPTLIPSITQRGMEHIVSLLSCCPARLWKTNQCLSLEGLAPVDHLIFMAKSDDFCICIGFSAMSSQ